MKLFISTNEGTISTPNIKMLEVAVKSALKNTNFDVFVIFDGDKSKLNLPEEVTVIQHRHRCYDTFKNSNRCHGDDGCLRIASSAFLRTEIPHIFENLGLNDEFCLYTDYDVMFLPGDYSDLVSLRPEVFSASPESNIKDWSYVNTGVMVKNVNFFKGNDEFMVDYINKNFETLDVWDQTVYNDLYIKKLTRLPIEYNWKPYWGINENAKIIHFHGPKPFVVTPKEVSYTQAGLTILLNRDLNSYDHYIKIFNEFL